MYIGQVKRFTLRFSYTHHANIGHNIKSRALETRILYNRIMDEQEGRASYAIDIPNGGQSYIIGNIIEQGPNTDNAAIISYGTEGLKNPDSKLWMVNNTVVNDRHTGVFIKTKQGAQAQIMNNLFVGKGKTLKGPGELLNNMQIKSDPGFVAMDNYDYRLVRGSQAIDSGLDTETLKRFKAWMDLVPQHEYIHKLKSKPRSRAGRVDIGAYEYLP
jgi:hypothetical protein